MMIPETMRSTWKVFSQRTRWSYLVVLAAGLSVKWRLKAYRDPLSTLMPSTDPSESPAREAPANFQGIAKARPSSGVLFRAVAVGTSFQPFRTTCMVRALTLAQLLRKFGYRSNVVIGVLDKPVFEHNSLFAHAWVELGGATQGPIGYKELARLQF